MELGRDMGLGQESATDGGEPAGHEQPATVAPESGTGGGEEGAQAQPAAALQIAPSAAETAGGQAAQSAATPSSATLFSALLAGLQAGMVGVLIMLAWLGVSAAWQQRSFWTAENLMATAFYGPQSIHNGFAGRTLPGLALYVVLYSALAAAIAMLLRDRLTRLRTALVCIVLAMVWYYVSFRWMWRHVMPLVALLHAERPTAIGHLIYGLWLGRFPAYLRKGH